jgi:hypothetical protein
MNSHIDNIIGLIDNVLGPDDNGPVPRQDRMSSYGDAHEHRVNVRPPVPSPWPEVFARQPVMGRNRSTRGRYRVNELSRLTLHDLEMFLGNKVERALTNNTKVARDCHGNLVVVLHRTAIMTYKRDVGGEIMVTLNSGGWRTVTTKARMNALLPQRYSVYADKGVWYVRVGSYPNADTLDYFDGINLYTGER